MLHYTMSQKFSDFMVQAVWMKGQIVPGADPNFRRKDSCGAWIDRDRYGDRSSQNNTGWEVDHINPNGGDDLSNLRPLQWYNNVAKSDGRLSCPIDGSNQVRN